MFDYLNADVISKLKKEDSIDTDLFETDSEKGKKIKRKNKCQKKNSQKQSKIAKLSQDYNTSAIDIEKSPLKIQTIPK